MANSSRLISTGIIAIMARLILYIPDELAARLGAEARQANLSLSRYIVGQLTKRRNNAWPEGYFENVCGSWVGDAPIIEDLPAEPFN